MSFSHVIILAQGSQKRMGSSTLGKPKQTLPLPACGGMSIIERTCHQVLRLANELSLPQVFITVVGPKDIVKFKDCKHGVVTLPDPGNSSLKGLSRYLAMDVQVEAASRTTVLLGDVVYSWSCLAELMLFRPAASTDACVCATSDLSPSDGELWGVSWAARSTQFMLGNLAVALEKHPPFDDTYQPGQLRRWLWAMPKHVQDVVWHRVDDYTRDIDLPEHLELIPELSQLAAKDDADHDVVYNSPIVRDARSPDDGFPAW